MCSFTLSYFPISRPEKMSTLQYYGELDETKNFSVGSYAGGKTAGA